MDLLSAAAVPVKPKVVRIIGRLNIGGPARQACLLHEKLTDCFDTHLIIGSLADGEQDMSYLLSSERNLLRLPQITRKVSLGSDALAFWKIFKFLRRARPDIVHTHTAKAGALGRLAARLAGVPVIVHTYHGHVFHGYFGPVKTRMYLAIERFLGRLSTKIIAISESQRQELCFKYRVTPAEKISVIHNGVLLEQFTQPRREEARNALGLPSDRLVAVWAGRMAPVKDVHLLAQVIRRANQQGSKVYFLVVGDGTERANLEAQISGCSNVAVLGWRRDIEQIWPAADVAILTSRNEGTPTSLIEAMAAGLPFVATRVGGVRDLAVGSLRELPHGMGHEAANGFLATPSPEAFLFCIEQLAADPSLAIRMASAGHAFVWEKFSVPRMVEEIESLYRALLSQRGKRQTSSSPGRIQSQSEK